MRAELFITDSIFATSNWQRQAGDWALDPPQNPPEYARMRLNANDHSSVIPESRYLKVPSGVRIRHRNSNGAVNPLTVIGSH